MPTRPAGELQALTGLRGIAALTVFIAHARFYEMAPVLRPALIFFEWHALAVDLFFMLSGFVLVHVYSTKLGPKLGKSWKSYFAARFARIVPLYLATLMACLGIFAAGSLILGRWPAHVTWDVVVTNLFLLQGWPGLYHMSLNTPSWSLSVEAFCYIFMMPLALLADHRVNRKWVVTLVVVALVIWRASMSGSDSGWIGLFRGISGFLAGSLIHKLYPLKNPATTNVTTGIAIVLFLVSQSLVAWGGFPGILPLFSFPFLILGLASSARSVLHAFFKSPVMLWLGDISYSVYLWHGAIFLATHNVIRPKLMTMPAPVHVAWIMFEFTFVLWISHISFHRFELPVRKALRS